MDPQKYTDSEKYQQEIAEQYKKRVSKFSNDEVLRVLQSLGITGVDSNSIQEAVVGNVNATYLTPKFVIKMNQNREHPDYLPNKIVSDKLSSKYPVVKVVVYDFFEKTDYEVLVMERAPGTLLLDDFLELSNASQIILFRQILEVVKQLFVIEFDGFGSINKLDNESFATYTDLLKNKFKQYTSTIREKELCDEKDMEKIEKYFLKNINIFDNEKPVFIHTDLHMGNILHEGSKLTAIIDFDSAQRAPKMCALVSLLVLPTFLWVSRFATVSPPTPTLPRMP